MHIVICLSGSDVLYLLLNDVQYREMISHEGDHWSHLSRRLDLYLSYNSLVEMIDVVRNQNHTLISETVVSAY